MVASAACFAEEYPAQWRSGKNVCYGRWAYQTYKKCRHKDHGVERYRLGDDKSRPKTFNWGEGPECGEPLLYKEGTGPMCKPAAYNSGVRINFHDRTIPLSGLYRSVKPAGPDPKLELSAYYTGNHYLYLNMHTVRGGADFNGQEEIKYHAIPRRIADYTITEVQDPIFGVKKYATCRHPSFGVEKYRGCLHENFGVAEYHQKRDPKYGPELFKKDQTKACGLSPDWHFTEESEEPQEFPTHISGLVKDSLICSTGDHLNVTSKDSFEKKYQFLKTRYESYKKSETKMSVRDSKLFGPVSSRELIEIVSQLKEIFVTPQNLGYANDEKEAFIYLVDHEYPNLNFGGPNRWQGDGVSSTKSSLSSRFSRLSTSSFLSSRKSSETPNKEATIKEWRKGIPTVSVDIGDQQFNIEMDWLDEAEDHELNRNSDDNSDGLSYTSSRTSKSTRSSRSNRSNKSSISSDNRSTRSESEMSFRTSSDSSHVLSEQFGFRNLGKTSFANAAHILLTYHPRFTTHLREMVDALDDSKPKKQVLKKLGCVLGRFRDRQKDQKNGTADTFPKNVSSFYESELEDYFDELDRQLKTPSGTKLRRDSIQPHYYLDEILKWTKHSSKFNSLRIVDQSQIEFVNEGSAQFLDLKAGKEASIRGLLSARFGTESPSDTRLVWGDPTGKKPSQLLIHLERDKNTAGQQGAIRVDPFSNPKIPSFRSIQDVSLKQRPEVIEYSLKVAIVVQADADQTRPTLLM
jgi:hypothetical protein